jgi:type I restriction enzyme M protein
MNTSSIVQKLWNYCNVLRDDGMSYGDYVEQLTYLLFLKMADERTRAPYKQKSPVPETYGWPSLIRKDGDELFDHYRHTLEALGNQTGLLGLIFNNSQNKSNSAHRWSSAYGRSLRQGSSHSSGSSLI